MQVRLLAFFLAALFVPVFSPAQSWNREASTGSLSGRVMASGTSRGVSGAAVHVSALTGGGLYQTETDGDGNFEIQGLRTGPYLVRVIAAGSPDLEQTVDVDTSGASVELYLSRPAHANREADNTVSVRELSIPVKARSSYEKGVRLLEKGDATKSRGEFEHAIAKYPSYYEAYYQLGRAQFDLGLLQDATDAFSKSIQLSGGHFAQPYFGLALVLSQENHFAEADTAAKIGLSLEPDSPIGQLSLSWAELGLGQLQSAEKLLREVLERQPDLRQARLMLVEVHQRENKLPDVVEDVKAYLKIDSASATSAQLRQLRDDTLRTLSQSDDKPGAAARTQP